MMSEAAYALFDARTAEVNMQKMASTQICVPAGGERRSVMASDFVYGESPHEQAQKVLLLAYSVLLRHAPPE